jgi:predicted RNA methylase
MARHDQSLDELDLHPRTQDAEDWQPTPHGRFMAGVLHENPELYADREVLELGAGTALHTVLLERGGAKRVVATEHREDLLATVRANLEAHGCGERTELRVADWLGTEGRFDVVVANPPFCKSGMRNRRYFIDELILNGFRRLRRDGTLLFVQSSMADFAKTERRLAENGFEVRRLDQTRGPFRDYYYEEPGFLEEARRVDGGFSTLDGEDFEDLAVFAATLRAV